MRRGGVGKRAVPLDKFIGRRTAPRPKARGDESPAIPRAPTPRWLESPSASPVTPTAKPVARVPDTPPPAPKKKNAFLRAQHADPAGAGGERGIADMGAGPFDDRERADSILAGLPLGFLEFAVLNGPRLRAHHSGSFALWSAELLQMWRLLSATTRAAYEANECGPHVMHGNEM